MMKNNRKKRGFTILETIIAMVVIVVVSIAAATATVSGIQAGRNVARDADAIRCAENVLECFKATETIDAFVDAVRAVEAIEEEEISSQGSEYVFKKDAGYTVNLQYSESTITVTVTADDDGDVIVEYSYTKEVRSDET